MNPGTVRCQIADCIIGITYADLGFHTGNLDAWVTGELACGRDPFVKGREPHRVLERIARRHKPPHVIESQPFHCQQAGGKMRLVRRIEGSAEQPDSLAGIMRRNTVMRAIRSGAS